jgi:K+-transporting ATPase A subunit
VGGGYYNASSAMPFENAGWLSNLVQMLLIVLVPAALTATFGRDHRRQPRGQGAAVRRGRDRALRNGHDVGRLGYLPMIAAPAVAGAISTRPLTASGRGTLRTDNPTFVSLVLAVVVVVVVVVLLTFVPALLLGSGVQRLTDRLF